MTDDTNGDSIHEYQGYSIEWNLATGRWEVFWRERKQKRRFRAGSGCRRMDRLSNSVASILETIAIHGLHGTVRETTSSSQ